MPEYDDHDHDDEATEETINRPAQGEEGDLVAGHNYRASYDFEGYIGLECPCGEYLSIRWDEGDECPECGRTYRTMMHTSFFLETGGGEDIDIKM